MIIGDRNFVICDASAMEESIIAWVERHRTRLKISQAGIGKIIGVSQPQARDRLLGKVEFSLSEIEKLERHFGAEAPFRRRSSDEMRLAEEVPAFQSFKQVPEYDVGVSAGGGALIDGENMRGQWPFDPSYLSDVLGLANANLAILEVRGDSMEPTLSSGDRVMVNMSDKQVSQPGIFILWDGDGTVIKRVEKVPGVDKLVLISDNTRHGKYEVDGENLQIVGRVVWAARRL